MAAGKSDGSAGEITFLEALARSECKRDGGFKNNWSFDHGEESEGDTDKDEANLLSVDEDEDSETSKRKKLNRQSEIVATSSVDPWKTCARRNKIESLKPLKGNAIGLNMLSNNKKLRYRLFTMRPYRKDERSMPEANRPRWSVGPTCAFCCQFVSRAKR